MAMLVQEPGWVFGQDTRVSTTTLAMSAMGSLGTTGSHPKDGALDRKESSPGRNIPLAYVKNGDIT